VVFDGWRSGWDTEHEERVGGISVIFSRKGERADAVIARLAQEMGGACLVVTSDREVQKAASTSGGTAVYSGEFEDRLRAALVGETPPSPIDKDEAEDAAMVRTRFGVKKGNPFRRSRSERKRISRLKKL
jgi:hypothetical protein